MALDKQVQILSVDTGNFYYADEAELHKINQDKRIEKNKLINGYDEKQENKTTTHIMGTKEILEKLKTLGYSQKEIESFKDEIPEGVSDEVICLAEEYLNKSEQIKQLVKEAKETKNQLLDILKTRIENNINTNGKDHIRELNISTLLNKDGEIKNENIISVFDSSFTRMINAKQDELSEDFMVVQVYYFDVIKDLIYYGFKYKGEKYIYFTSSAGQIRTKKTVFIKESVWKEYEKTIMCGLTIDSINKKGGNNPNKHLAYMALSNSATDIWEEFDIDKSIVIDDFETNVFGTYDLIDDIDYSIKRVSDYVPITHTDGAGMMLPCMGKNRMVRLPWIKGLLGVFDYKKFIEINNCPPIIKDIYGKKHDIIAEDIQIIFTKSQFKMWKYYDSWEQYKEFYKKYKCTAGYTNMEEDRIKNATINYQMLQSLVDITDEEIDTIIRPSVEKLTNLCSSVENIKEVFGATPYNMSKTALQEAICIYPELLNDVYIRNKLKDMKDSMVKKYKAGKLQIYGKYTFLLPDYYAACEYWFLNIKQPKGLLDDGEVFCWLFRTSPKLDCLRSPHLFREHAIRKNIAWNKYEDKQKKLREWFITDAVYTSSYDLISKILQFDVDGDKSLVVADKNIISVAERNMEGIVPLYYNMRKASPSILNNQTIYDGLSAAFSGSNIGTYSNNISKIWNSEVFISGTDEEKQKAIDVIKLLCMENNFVIDRAKTLYMPERPKFVKKLVTDFTKCNVPHFFKYAKDKEDWQVEPVNQSFVNKLETKIPNPRISFRYIDTDSGIISFKDKNGKTKKLLKPNPKFLMRNPDIEISDEIIKEYSKLCKEYHYKVDAMSNKHFSAEILMKSQIRQNILYSTIIADTRNRLSQYGYSNSDVADMLVKYLYEIKNGKYKDVLWTCYGDYLLENLKNHQSEFSKDFSTKEIECIDCGEWIRVSNKDTKTCRCENCTIEHKRELTRLRVKKYRDKNV